MLFFCLYLNNIQNIIEMSFISGNQNDIQKWRASFLIKLSAVHNISVMSHA